MGLTGKYDFKGIKKVGAASIRSALLPAWFLKLGKLGDAILELLTNFLANKGLVVLNLGAIYIEGELDQRGLDSAMDEALSEITNLGGRKKLTAAQKKAIDDEVIKAARELIVVSKRK